MRQEWSEGVTKWDGNRGDGSRIKTRGSTEEITQPSSSRKTLLLILRQTRQPHPYPHTFSPSAILPELGFRQTSSILNMACSSAQVHGLGTPSFASSRTLFLGQRLNTKAFIKVKSKPRRVGPLRVVNEKVVGIDLGTTNSAVAAMEGGKPTIITNAEGQRTTPSVVAYTKNGDRLVGQIAKRQAVVNPENTFFSVKRFIGRKMSEVDEESKQVSYRVIRDDNGNVKLDCPAIGKQFAAEEISAQVTFLSIFLHSLCNFRLLCY